ncbi:hypothetical protein ACOMHN_032891 [Nucella lapillus]
MVLAPCGHRSREVEAPEEEPPQAASEEPFGFSSTYTPEVSACQNFRDLEVHGELSLEGRGERHHFKVSVSLSLAPRLSNNCRQ